MNEKEKFDKWYSKIDAIITRKFGIGVDDLVDTDTYSMFQDGLTPGQAAKEILSHQ